MRWGGGTQAAVGLERVAASAPATAPGEAKATDAQESEPYAHPRRWLIFGIVSMALMMGSVDQTIVATALQTIRHSLHSPVNWSSWTITAYQLGAVLTLPVAGRISDLYGRKRIFLCCVVLFTLTSLACGMATSIYVLVPLRALQALGGGAFMPSASGIVADNFGRDRDRAIGMFTSIYPLGAFIGPILGGVITQEWSWRGIFLINVPIGALLLALGLRYLPHSVPKTGRRPDFLGTALLGGMLITTMFGITTLGRGSESLASVNFLLPVGVGVGFGVLFARQMRRSEQPIIPVQLLRQRHFATMNVIALIYGGCALGFGTLVPLYAQQRYHVHVLQAGTVLIARALGSVAVASATSFLLRRIGYRIPMVTGFVLGAAGLCMLAFAPRGMSVFAWLSVGSLVMGLGNGISAPATNNAILSFAPEQVASISGLRGMFRQIGGMIAISVTTALVARSANEGLALSHAILVFSFALLVVAVPLVFTVPARRGTW